MSKNEKQGHESAPTGSMPKPKMDSPSSVTLASAPDPRMQGSVNQQVGDYEILGVLGAGGMGQVYRVRNVIFHRIEAMKILLPDLAGRPELADTLLSEIKPIASLYHPNIASLHTALKINNQLVIITELVDGVTLAQLLERGPIPIPDALIYLDQTLSALEHAHGKGVIHRDIRPTNMMLTPAGQIKLTDFGISRADTQRELTATGAMLGSIDYMSPEQVTVQATDARSDLYSIGVTLYEMVTGQRPFKGNSDFELMAAHVKEMPTSPLMIQPNMPARLSEIIMKAIAKAPEDRYQRAEELRQALHSVPQSMPSGIAMMLDRPAASPVREVARTPVYNSPPPPPAALMMSSSSKNVAIYAVCGIVLALAVAVPIGLTRHTSTETNTQVPVPIPVHPSPVGPTASKDNQPKPQSPTDIQPVVPTKPQAAMKEMYWLWPVVVSLITLMLFLISRFATRRPRISSDRNTKPETAGHANATNPMNVMNPKNIGSPMRPVGGAKVQSRRSVMPDELDEADAVAARAKAYFESLRS